MGKTPTEMCQPTKEEKQEIVISTARAVQELCSGYGYSCIILITCATDEDEQAQAKILAVGNKRTLALALVKAANIDADTMSILQAAAAALKPIPDTSAMGWEDGEDDG